MTRKESVLVPAVSHTFIWVTKFDLASPCGMRTLIKQVALGNQAAGVCVFALTGNCIGSGKERHDLPNQVHD